MDRDSLHKDGLLEQYLLGLTSREETKAVEDYLATDPDARRDLEFMRKQLGVYLEERGVEERDPVADQEPQKEDSEEVFLSYLLHRNQRLNAMRSVLFVVSLLLLGTSVYFYRQSRQLERELLTAKAIHVQDDNIHEMTLRELSHSTVDLDSLHTVVAQSGHGNLQLHYLTADSVILLDLSHLKIPEKGYAYHVHLQHGTQETSKYIVGQGGLNALYPIDDVAAQLKVLYGLETTDSQEKATVPDLVANLDLFPSGLR